MFFSNLYWQTNFISSFDFSYFYIQFCRNDRFVGK